MSSKGLPSHGGVATVSSAATLREAAETMKREAVGCLVVEDAAGTPVGMLTDRDLTLRAVAWSRDPESPVAEVMSTPLEVADAEQPRAEIAGRMAALGIRRMPLLREGRLDDLLTLDDLAFDTALELDELSQAISGRLHRARREGARDARMQHAEEALAGLRERLQRANWMTQRRFLDELDELRERVAKAVLGDRD